MSYPGLSGNPGRGALRRALIALAALALILGLGACGEDEQSPSDEPSAPIDQPDADEAPTDSGEPSESGQAPPEDSGSSGGVQLPPGEEVPGGGGDEANDPIDEDEADAGAQSGGADAADAFELFCDENPDACR